MTVSLCLCGECRKPLHSGDMVIHDEKRGDMLCGEDCDIKRLVRSHEPNLIKLEFNNI